MQDPIRWGIIGTGDICRQFVSDLQHVDGAEAAAVGSRAQQTADAFADTHGIPARHASYEALANDPAIDAVYIGTPHPFHCANTLMCLEAGKPVVCEKPLGMNAREVERMIDAARLKGVFLMEAMWTAFFPAMQEALAWAHGGAIGGIRQVSASFCFPVPLEEAGRLFNLALGGGSLLDVGIYPVALSQLVFQEPPTQVSGWAHLGETGVDENAGIVLGYTGGQLATLSSGIRNAMPQRAVISGTEGWIDLPHPFYQPGSAALYHGEREIPVERVEHGRAGYGYHYEAEAATRYIREGRTEAPEMTWAASLQLARTLDRIRGHWGLRYAADED